MVVGKLYLPGVSFVCISLRTNAHMRINFQLTPSLPFWSLLSTCIMHEGWLNKHVNSCIFHRWPVYRGRNGHPPPGRCRCPRVGVMEPFSARRRHDTGRRRQFRTVRRHLVTLRPSLWTHSRYRPIAPLWLLSVSETEQISGVMVKWVTKQKVGVFKTL